MKTIKYITITLFALVGVLWGLLLSGCESKLQTPPKITISNITEWEIVSNGSNDSSISIYSRHKDTLDLVLSYEVHTKKLIVYDSAASINIAVLSLVKRFTESRVRMRREMTYNPDIKFVNQ